MENRNGKYLRKQTETCGLLLPFSRAEVWRIGLRQRIFWTDAANNRPVGFISTQTHTHAHRLTIHTVLLVKQTGSEQTSTTMAPVCVCAWVCMCVGRRLCV